MARKDKAAEAASHEESAEQTEVANTENPAAEAAPATERKSIVPGGWKSKEDDLAKFINEQCTGKDGFQWPAFFELARKNIGGSLTADKIAHYEGQVAEKSHGAQGRAKMTIRNMLATNARKNGKLIGLDDAEVALDLPKPAVSGAAAKAKEAAAQAETNQTA